LVESMSINLKKIIKFLCTNRIGHIAAPLAKGDLNAILEYCSSVRGISTIAQRACLLGAALESEYQKYYDWENRANALIAASEKAALDHK